VCSTPCVGPACSHSRASRAQLRTTLRLASLGRSAPSRQRQRSKSSRGPIGVIKKHRQHHENPPILKASLSTSDSRSLIVQVLSAVNVDGVGATRMPVGTAGGATIGSTEPCDALPLCRYSMLMIHKCLATALDTRSVRGGVGPKASTGQIRQLTGSVGVSVSLGATSRREEPSACGAVRGNRP